MAKMTDQSEFSFQIFQNYVETFFKGASTLSYYPRSFSESVQKCWIENEPRVLLPHIC